jgi:hypothetical protein
MAYPYGLDRQSGLGRTAILAAIGQEFHVTLSLSKGAPAIEE